MEERDILMELEEPLRRISCGINAIELMMYGMGQTKAPYADGFFAVWNYLRDAESMLREKIDCLASADQ